MKQLYSIILLFAFFVGAIQPVVPLLEFHFFKQSIIELLCENRDIPESDCDGICYLSNQIEESQQNQSDLQTIYASYYPGAILYDYTSAERYFADELSFRSIYSVDTFDIFHAIDLPPPKLS
ncbi:MAG: hypothetical protein WEA56_09760 [Balneolaceae bacterium]